jgi:hypothetical protein
VSENIAELKRDREDAAQHRKVARMLLARRQLDAWFPDNLEVVERAIKGDDQAIWDLVTVGNHWGDPMVAWILGMIVPDGNEGMRKAVSLLWSGHRRSAMEQLETRQAQDLLRRYGTKPVDCPKQITIYRGGHGYTLQSVARGWSWTTDLPTAAFFVDYQKIYVERDERSEMQPYLLKATVKTSQIVHVDDERGEEEKVIFGVRDYEVHGTPEDWKQWSGQREARRLARLQKL